MMIPFFSTPRGKGEPEGLQDKRMEEADESVKQAEVRTETAEATANALRASELSYRRLSEAARDGILILEVETGRITDVNPFLVELLGFSHTEMVDQTIGELSPFKDVVYNQAMLDQLRKYDVDLGRLTQEIVDELQAETKERRIVFNIQSLPVVWADRALLRLVLVNLVCNSIKFTSHHLEAEIEIETHPSPDFAETIIFVRDNGAGFASKYIEKLFKVFQRLHSQTEFEGTGIGLANVQRIVQRHGGRVWAEGEEEKGATFYFTIPHKQKGCLE